MPEETIDEASAARRAPGGPNADDPRYERLIRATYRAAGEGYDAVTMRRLAAETRMSLAKIYEFAGSKDELIARAHAGGMAALSAELATRPPEATRAADRIAAALDRFADALEDDEVRTRALMQAMYSTDPRIGPTMATMGSTFGSIVDAALGDTPVSRRAEKTEILGDVVNSAILQWLNRRLDGAGVRARLHRAASVLFDDP